MSDPSFGHVGPETLALFTDLYELRMMEGYLEADHEPVATFDLFVRDLPPDRGYLVAAGLEQAIAYVDSISFGERALAFLAELDFGETFLEYLSEFEFTGEIRALPEGTLAFQNEPLVEVTGPIVETQLFETLLINQIGFQSLIATKAARMRDAVDRHGDDQSLVDFGSRRAHGTDAGMKAARAAYVGGVTGTSNVAAAEAFDIPAFGTMAHSWIQSFATEREAFEAFVDVYGEDAVLLVDTYDTVAGAELAVDVAEDANVDIAGVRLDSGDLTALSKTVGEVVDGADVFISSGVDEFLIEEFLRNDGVADGFGPGTALVTSTDAPRVEAVYKLVAVERDGDLQPSMKLSTGKVTFPGPKSVRRIEREGRFERDVLDRHDGGGGEIEERAGEEQLVPIFEDGSLVYDSPSLDRIQDRTRTQLAKLPEEHRALRDPTPYEVTIGESLRKMTGAVRSDLEARR